MEQNMGLTVCQQFQDSACQHTLSDPWLGINNNRAQPSDSNCFSSTFMVGTAHYTFPHRSS